MCGRYSFERNLSDKRFAAIHRMMEEKYPGGYKLGEIFPGDVAPGLIARGERVTAVPAAFGFPGFTADRRIINARAETAADKPMFAAAMRSSRMILPATGFYEWGQDEKHTKYLCTLEQEAPVYLCGLYRRTESGYCFVILTRPANESMLPIHPRMPVTVEPEQVRAYLTNYDAAVLLLAAAAPAIRSRPA